MSTLPAAAALCHPHLSSKHRLYCLCLAPALLRKQTDLQTAKLLVDYKASKAPWLMNTKVNLFQRLKRGGGAEHNLYCEQIWDKVQALMLHLFVVWSKVRHELCWAGMLERHAAAGYWNKWKPPVKRLVQKVNCHCISSKNTSRLMKYQQLSSVTMINLVSDPFLISGLQQGEVRNRRSQFSGL